MIETGLMTEIDLTEHLLPKAVDETRKYHARYKGVCCVLTWDRY
jgi:hypothetical protein